MELLISCSLRTCVFVLVAEGRGFLQIRFGQQNAKFCGVGHVALKGLITPSAMC